MKRNSIILFVIWQLLPARAGNILAQTPPPMAPEIWSEPMQVPFLATLEHIEAQPSIMDYSRLFLFKTDGIAVSTLQDGIWGDPTMLNNRIYAGNEESPSISPDGEKLYFRRYGGGYGAWDLWVSVWSDSLNDWGETKNLGPNINTDDDEWFCFTPDNKNLYFGRWVDMGQHVEFELLVSYYDSTRGT